MLTCSSKGLYQRFIYSCFYKILTLVKNCKQGTRKSHIIITHTHQLFLHLPHLLYSPFLSLFCARARTHTHTIDCFLTIC